MQCRVSCQMPKKAAEQASDIVKEEYSIIDNIKQSFGTIQEEMQTLVATSEENSATI